MSPTDKRLFSIPFPVIDTFCVIIAANFSLSPFVGSGKLHHAIKSRHSGHIFFSVSSPLWWVSSRFFALIIQHPVQCTAHKTVRQKELTRMHTQWVRPKKVTRVNPGLIDNDWIGQQKVCAVNYRILSLPLMRNKRLTRIAADSFDSKKSWKQQR